MSARPSSSRTAKPPEIAVRHWFRDQWPYWKEFREPARGVGTGSPDCLFMTADGFLTPLEFKVGWFDKVKGFESTPLRPAQMEWHRRFVLAGGIALIGVGFYHPESGDMMLGMCTSMHAPKFKTRDLRKQIDLECAWDSQSLDRVVAELLMEADDVLGGSLDQRVSH